MAPPFPPTVTADRLAYCTNLGALARRLRPNMVAEEVAERPAWQGWNDDAFHSAGAGMPFLWTRIASQNKDIEGEKLFRQLVEKYKNFKDIN